jgi:NADPH-dependent curcumin reductase CurA
VIAADLSSAVGSVVVQIAKNVLGCKTVIGIAGGKAKCDWYVVAPCLQNLY